MLTWLRSFFGSRRYKQTDEQIMSLKLNGVRAIEGPCTQMRTTSKVIKEIQEDIKKFNNQCVAYANHR